MKKLRTLRELFSVEGFSAYSLLEGRFGDHKARVVVLRRQKKQQFAQHVERNIEATTIKELVMHAIVIREATVFIFVMKDDASIAKNAGALSWKA